MTKRKPGEPFVAPLPDSLVQRHDGMQGADAHAGQGGSYVLDPVTGQRTLVERTKERGEVAAPTEKE